MVLFSVCLCHFFFDRLSSQFVWILQPARNRRLICRGSLRLAQLLLSLIFMPYPQAYNLHGMLSLTHYLKSKPYKMNILQYLLQKRYYVS